MSSEPPQGPALCVQALRPALCAALVALAGCSNGPVAEPDDALDGAPRAPLFPDAPGPTDVGREPGLDAPDTAGPDGPDTVESDSPDTVRLDVPDAVGPDSTADAVDDAGPAPPLTLESLSPAPAATTAPLDTAIVATFSTALGDLPPGALTVRSPAGGVVAASLSQPGPTVLTLTLAKPLAHATTYRVVVSPALVSDRGEAVAPFGPASDPLASTFTTAAAPTPAAPPLDPAAVASLADTLEGAWSPSSLSGQTFGGLVWDLSTQTPLWSRQPDLPLIPASNTKLFTSAAALAGLGADYRFAVRVFASVPWGDDGVLDGDLGVHGTHDHTLSTWFFDDPREPLDRLAAELYAAGLRTVTGQLVVQGAYCYEGHHFYYYSPQTHRDRVEVALSAALLAAGITVQGGAVDVPTMDEPEGEVVATWESPPLVVGLWPINRKSHNEMADILLRHVGWVLGGTSDYPTGAGVVLDWLEGQPLETTELTPTPEQSGGVDHTAFDTAGMYLGDGSGLDTANRVSARHLVDLYRLAYASDWWDDWESSLTIAGVEGPGSTNEDGSAFVRDNSHPYMGSFAFRMMGPATRGRVRGKSGTNAGIVTSGLLEHPVDGRPIAFAFLSNGISTSAYSSARATHDALATDVAEAVLVAGGAPLPPPPEAAGALAAADGAVTVSWASMPDVVDVLGEGGAAAYRVEVSADGRAWPVEQAVTTTSEQHTFAAGSFPFQATSGLHLRVRGVTPAGAGPPSDVVAAWAGPPPPPFGAGPDVRRALFIDANERWQDEPQPENPTARSHGFVSPAARAWVDAGVAFDTVARASLFVPIGEEKANPLVALEAYDLVYWEAGEDATVHVPATTDDRALMTAYLESPAGGVLIASGTDLAWTLTPGASSIGTAEGAAWLASVGATYVADDAEAFEVFGAGALAGIPAEPRLDFWTPGGMFVGYPEALSPLSPAEPLLVYADGTAAATALELDAGTTAIVSGIPLFLVPRVLTEIAEAWLD